MIGSLDQKSESNSLGRLCDYIEVVKSRVAIAVVYSGDPLSDKSIIQQTANIRTWKSYQSVAEQIATALREAGFKYVDTIAEGSELASSLEKRTYQLYWLNTGGMQGRDPMSHTPALLENLGVPYIGHTPLHAALLDDKVSFKQWLRGIGLPTAPFIVRGSSYAETISAKQSDFIREFGLDYRGPFLVKPASGRGSVDVHVADDIQTAIDLTNEIRKGSNAKVIVEQFLVGSEYCVWGSRGIIIKNLQPQTWQNPFAFGASERLYSLSNRIFRKADSATRTVDPARLLEERDEIVIDGLNYLGRTIFTHLGLATPVRLDVRRREDGTLSVLEVNPKPDLAKPLNDEVGLLRAALSDLDCSYNDFILKIIYDWLDFYLRYYPKYLSLLNPLFQRYSPQPLTASPQQRRAQNEID